jgi:hypothetical protein
MFLILISLLLLLYNNNNVTVCELKFNKCYIKYSRD